MNKFLIPLFLLPAALWAQDPARQIDKLIPKLSDENIEARYAPQMAFRDLASVAGRPGAEAERKAFVGEVLKRLASDETPQAAKVWFVRELEHIGQGESVPGLAKLLADSDSELREVARRALEKNSDPAASAALLDALDRHDAPWQAGIINALGQRRAPAATSALRGRLDDSELRGPAARALGKIANPEAVDALRGAWDKADPGFTQILSKSMIEATRHLPENQAKDLCTFLFDAPKTPVATRIAAWKHTYLAAPSDEALLAGVRHQNLDISGAAIRSAAGNQSGTIALAKAMADMDKTVQVRVLGLLGDQGTPAAVEGVLIQASKSGDADVRRAAIQAMESASGAAVATALLTYAAAGDGDAKRALTKLQGDAAQNAINEAMASGDGAIRVTAINTLTDRGVPHAGRLLVKMAADPDGSVSAAALNVLGKLAQGDDIPALLDLAGKNPRAIGVLRNAANRAVDKDGATALVVDRLGTFSGKEKAAMLKVLPVLGSAAGLDLLAKSNDGDAMRALAEWPDDRAVPALLQNAGKASFSDGEHVTIVRGLIRLLPASKIKAETKVEMTSQLLGAARTPDIRKQVVTLFGDITHPASAAALVEVIKGGKYKDEANLTGVKLAENLLKKKKKEAVASLSEAVLAAGATGQTKRKAEELLRKAN